MYLINKEENEISRLQSCSFSELDFLEYLQVWFRTMSAKQDEMTNIVNGFQILRILFIELFQSAFENVLKDL